MQLGISKWEIIIANTKNIKQYEQYVSWAYWHNVSPKITKEKLAKFTKILNYTKCSCTIFCVKISQYFNYNFCLQEDRRYKTFWSKGFYKFWSGGIDTV